MNHRLLMCFAGLALAASGAARAADLTQGARSFVRDGAAWRPVWFLCDPQDATPLTVVGLPAQGRVSILRVATRPTPMRVTLALGLPDPGAGQIYYDLGGAHGSRGNLHGLNPAVFDPPPRLPSFGAVTLDGVTSDCRMPQGGVLLGAGAGRSIVVSIEHGRPVYRAFPRGSAQASLTIVGGRITRAGGGVVYRFVHAGYGYRVAASRTRPDGTVTVTRGGRIVQTERFIAYEIAAD